VEELRAAEINASVQPSGFEALWDKAAMLIPFATITTAASCGLGALVADPEGQTLVRQLSDEAVAVAHACGADAPEEIVSFRRMVETRASRTPGFSSSMNRDLLAGKPIELEWLTGKLIRLADQNHVEVPAHNTLYALIKMRLAARAT
jgi:2-dehydropantoate 2-reductase